jgi:cellulose synthase/poly-beta-1,6-N-acetylglucosamine synthase-like glycosyltransferase
MAVEWRDLFIHLMNIFNMIIVAYFFLAYGGYTILMALSLTSLLIYNRRLRYQGLEELRDSVVTPPVTVIMPAYNEQEVIVESVRSVLRTDYPYLEVVVVDDGSSDESLNRLIAAYQLIKMDLIYRPRLATEAVRGFYLNPAIPNLLVISKDNGGKFDALNVGINACRTPYFCTLDADCILERDALLRLMRPIKRDPLNIVASGGIVRILNGCEVKDGQVVSVALPDTALERFQVVEYLRGFLFGRTGWDLLHGTLIVSGAFASSTAKR